jgi:peptide deformylase
MSEVDMIVEDLETLKTVSDPVDSPEEALEIMERLEATLSSVGGAGLAAIQIGIPKRIAIVEDKGKYYSVINPEVVEAKNEMDSPAEGCLSIPGVRRDVKRWRDYTIKTQVIEDGEFVDRTWYYHYDDENPRLECVAVQHEIDHFDGRLITDHGFDSEFIKAVDSLPNLESKDQKEEPLSPIVNSEVKVGRNDPCPCGSGKKFKKCCINKGE